MAPPRAELSADKVEDDVLDRIPSLDAEQLEEVCGIVNLEVDEGLKGKRRDLKKLLMKYLCTPGADDDDKLADFLAIHEHLEIGEEEEEEEENVEHEKTKVKDETAAVVKKEEPAAAAAESTKPTVSEKAEAKPVVKKKAKPSVVDSSVESVSEDKVEIRRVRVAKDFKLPGMIGGTTEHALSYTSLEFEIEKGRKLGFSDHEMCPTVISKIADKELKQYFETEGDMTLHDVLDMLKSACSEPESSAMFTKFTTDEQAEDEKPIAFITRVLRLRKKVAKMGEEEGTCYPKEMLAKRSFEVIFRGLRDETIRTRLREETNNDHNLPDKVVYKKAAAIIAAEKERKEKLFGKKEVKETEVDVNAVDSTRQGSFAKKEKRNPFSEIDQMRNEMSQNQNEIKEMFLQFKNQYLDNNNNSGGDRRPRRNNRCPTCIAKKELRCKHCWGCGSEDHRKNDCPEN